MYQPSGDEFSQDQQVCQPVLISDSNDFGPNTQSQYGGDDDFVYMSNDERGWTTVSCKRPRVSSGSTSDPLGPKDFTKLNADAKQNLMFSKLCALENKIDSCLSICNRVNDIENIIDVQNKRLTYLEYKSLDLEARSRRNNLLFVGIKESQNENCLSVISSFLRDYLDISQCPPIPRVHRLGAYRRGRDRPIIANFLDSRDTEFVISRAKRLKNTAFSINRDFPQEIVSARKGLWPEFKKVRQAYPDKRVNLVFPAKIIIDGRVHANAFPDWDASINRSSRIQTNSTPPTQSASSFRPRVSTASQPAHSLIQQATTTPTNTCPIPDLHNSRVVSASMQTVDASTDKPAFQQQACVPGNGTTQVNHALHVQPINPWNCTQSALNRVKSATPRARQESKSPNPVRRQRQRPPSRPKTIAQTNNCTGADPTLSQQKDTQPGNAPQMTSTSSA